MFTNRHSAVLVRFLVPVGAGFLMLGGPIARASTITCESFGSGDSPNSQTTKGPSSCGANILNNNTQIVTHTISVPVDQDTSVDNFDTFIATTNSSSSASGTLGTAHAFASVIGSDGPAFYSYTSTYSLLDENGFTKKDANGDPLIVHFSTTDSNPLSFGGNAVSQITWTEVITLFNPLAAPGSMVSFNVSAPLHASVSSSDCGLGNALAKNYFEVDYAGIINGITFAGANIGAALEMRSACDPQQNLSSSATLQAPVGSVLYLYGQLRLAAGGSGNVPNFSAIADAANTGHYYVDVLTPNAFYLDENGLRNSLAAPLDTAVPEPGSMALLCLGLAAIGVARRSRPLRTF